MSGAKVSYNLRPNKYVERQLFIELLGKICLANSQDRYVYVSLGGPQLEDHKAIHQALGMRKLISIEADPVVYQRQNFNLRPYVKCTKQTTSDFIVDFDNFLDSYQDNNFIIWLDYASAKERYDQLNEYQTLLSKLEVGDILKITINSNPYSFSEKLAGENSDAYQQRMFECLKNQLQQYFPNSSEDNFSWEDMVARRFPILLCKAIRKASLNAMKGKRCQALPLATFCYQDGNHLMLTMTVILLQKGDQQSFSDDLRNKGWSYIPENWGAFTKINVPNLTAKERLHIESLLFSASNESIHENLPFRFADKKNESLEIFQQYVDHYRRYPSYFQVHL
jgi:hypothetical protein